MSRRSLGCTTYGFFGYSFGGVVGLELAAADPRLTGLIALGTVFDPPDAEPASVAYGQAQDEGGMAAVISLIEDEEQIRLPAWARAEFMETDAEQFRLTIAANAGDPDPWELLPRIGARPRRGAGGSPGVQAMAVRRQLQPPGRQSCSGVTADPPAVDLVHPRVGLP